MGGPKKGRGRKLDQKVYGSHEQVTSRQKQQNCHHRGDIDRHLITHKPRYVVPDRGEYRFSGPIDKIEYGVGLSAWKDPGDENPGHN